jgi:hypothetical protein
MLPSNSVNQALFQKQEPMAVGDQFLPATHSAVISTLYQAPFRVSFSIKGTGFS